MTAFTRAKIEKVVLMIVLRDGAGPMRKRKQ